MNLKELYQEIILDHGKNPRNLRKTENFNKEKGGKGVFKNSGVMVGRQVWTTKTEPEYDGPCTTLKDILVSHNEVSEEFYLGEDLEKWEYLKGAKREKRKKSNGEIFYYVELG